MTVDCDRMDLHDCPLPVAQPGPLVAYGRFYTAPPGTEPTADFEGWTEMGYVTEDIVLEPGPFGLFPEQIRVLEYFTGKLTFQIEQIGSGFRILTERLLAIDLPRRRRVSKLHSDYRAKTRRRNRRRK